MGCHPSHWLIFFKMARLHHQPDCLGTLGWKVVQVTSWNGNLPGGYLSLLHLGPGEQVFVVAWVSGFGPLPVPCLPDSICCNHRLHGFELQASDRWQLDSVSSWRDNMPRGATKWVLKIMGVPNSWMVYSGKSTSINLVNALEHDFYFSIQLGMSSSQLTSCHIFQRGRLPQPPTRHKS